MRKVHLHKDLGIYKAAIKNSVEELVNELSQGEIEERVTLEEAVRLINRRGSTYTIAEAEVLVSWYVTAHDECVSENPDDFEPLQVYVANKKIERSEKALEIIQTIKAQ